MPQEKKTRLTQREYLSRLVASSATLAFWVWAMIRTNPPQVSAIEAPTPQPTQPVPVEIFPTVTAAPEIAELLISPIFTPSVQYWAADISRWANTYGLDPNLVATVMQIESCGDPLATSGSGAMGLFQVMPFHFDLVGGEDPYFTDSNAHRGLGYLVLGLQKAGGDVGLALAGYNGGHSRIGQDSSLWPQETQRYYYWGTGIYQDATEGRIPSPRLTEWLVAAGGLCQTAETRLGIE